MDNKRESHQVILPDHGHGRLAYRTTWMQLPPAEELYEFELSERNKGKCEVSSVEDVGLQSRNVTKMEHRQ